MLLKSVLAVVFLLVLPFTFAFENPICDQTDRVFSFLTDSRVIPASSHWLVYNGRIIRKDILEKQLLPAFRYIPAWKAYEEVQALGFETITAVPLSEIDTSYRVNSSPLADYSQFNDSDNHQAEYISLANSPYSVWGGLSVVKNKEYVPLKLFHWHLSADINSRESTERMNTLQADIVRHLGMTNLMPDIFAFTGTNTITGKESPLFPEFSEKLCRTLWKYRFNREPGTIECQMIKPDLRNAMGRHNIYWTEHILIISMLPAQPFSFIQFENCALDVEVLYPYASYLFLDVKYDNYIIPMMFFSSLDESVREMLAPLDTWQSCCSTLKRSVDSALEKTETMVMVSHINVPYFTVQDFAEQWAAKARRTEGATKELSLKNPLTQSFFRHYQGIDPKARHFSAVLSYRLSMADLEQPARAHTVPDDIYLEPPGTRQRFLKWQNYSQFYPSYTEIELDKAHLGKYW